MSASSNESVGSPSVKPLEGGPVVLLFGGESGERRVSVASAQHLAEALGLGDESLWFIAPDGRVFAPTQAELLAHKRPFETDFVVAGEAQYGSLVQGLDLSTAPSYWHWAQNLNGSLQNSFLIGSIDQALPQNFTVSFSRGVDFGVGYTLVIRSAGSDLNSPFSVLMFLFSGVLTGVLVHVKMKTRAFEKFRL